MHRVVCPFCRQRSKYVYALLFETVTLWKVTERKKKKLQHVGFLGYKLYLLYFNFTFTMGVVLRNLQNVVPLRRAKLRKDVEILRHIFGVQRFDMGIICVDNRKIQHINHIYRKKNQPTDVLSFPFYEVQPLSRLIFLALYFFFFSLTALEVRGL